jgi:hypothetical protein
MYLDVYRELFTTDLLDLYWHPTQETYVRTTPFHRVAVIGIAALAVAGLVGCATKKTTSAGAGVVSTSSSAASASSAAAPSTAPSTAPSDTATSSTVKATGGGKFCQQVASTINAAAARAAISGASNDLAASIKETQGIEAAVLKAAPNSIKPDLVVVFGATDKLYAALAKANYDYTKLDPAALADLQSPAVMTAEQHLNDYAKNTCGIDLGGGAAASSS